MQYFLKSQQFQKKIIKIIGTNLRCLHISFIIIFFNISIQDQRTDNLPVATSRRQVNNRQTDKRCNMEERERAKKNWVWRLDYLGPSPSPKHVLSPVSLWSRSPLDVVVVGAHTAHRARNYRGSFFLSSVNDCLLSTSSNKTTMATVKVSLSRLKDWQEKEFIDGKRGDEWIS